MPDNTLFAQVLDRIIRADHSPLCARLRETLVVREDDGTYIVSNYAEIRGLLHDQGLRSDTAPARRSGGRSISCSELPVSATSRMLGKIQSGRRHMRRIALTLASVICCLVAAGCDKCGDPVKFNVPGLPKACYDSPRQK